MATRPALWIGFSLLALVGLSHPGLAGEADTKAADPALVKAFRDTCAAKAAEAERLTRMAVEGKDGWHFIAADLRHLSVGTFWGEAAPKVSRASRPEWADPLPALLDFKDQLDKLKIKLILVPVPPKAIVYPDMLVDNVKLNPAAAPPLPRLDPSHQEFYRLLQDKGVQVVDLAEAMIDARKDLKVPALYCRTDAHWSPAGCELAAKILKERLKGRDWLKPATPALFATEAKTLEFLGDIEKNLRGEGGARESVPARIVTATAGGNEGNGTESQSSPVLLLGDSHCLVFHIGGDMLATGAGLADQLAAEIGIPIDVLGTKGSASTAVRMNLGYRVKADDKYLPGKKLVILCFAAREFTESQGGWRKVAIVK